MARRVRNRKPRERYRTPTPSSSSGEEFVDVRTVNIFNKISMYMVNFANFLATPYVVHIMCAFFVISWFVPDEYFQTIEVAYTHVYRKGNRTWEWSKENALRSYAVPVLYIWLFNFLSAFNIDNSFMIREMPRFIVIFFVVIGDASAKKFYNEKLGERQGKIAYTLYALNWFVGFCCGRSLANTVEMSLLMWFFAYYPDPLVVPIVLIVGLVRPTSALFTAPMVYYELRRMRLDFYISCFHSTWITLFFSLLIDRYYYGAWVFPPWNFFRFNLLEGGNAQFGREPWYYYIVNLPLLMPVECLVLLYSFCIRDRNVSFWRRHALSSVDMGALASIWYIFVHSIIAHKEHRFALPVIPILIAWIVRSLPSHSKKFVNATRRVIDHLIYINIPLIIFFLLFNQYGHRATIYDLQHRMNDVTREYEPGRVSFLTPCYTLPHIGFMHPVGLTWNITQLDCIEKTTLNGYPDHYTDQDVFFEDPGKALFDHWDHFVGLSEFVVMYRELLGQLRGSGHLGYVMLAKLYTPVKFHFHTHFPVGSNAGKSFVTLERRHPEIRIPNLKKFVRPQYLIP